MAKPNTATPGTSMAVGIAMGAGVGVLFENMAVGVAIGLVLGIAFGSATTGRDRSAAAPEEGSRKD
jgi:hypothetical protein